MFTAEVNFKMASNSSHTPTSETWKDLCQGVNPLLNYQPDMEETKTIER